MDTIKMDNDFIRFLGEKSVGLEKQAIIGAAGRLIGSGLKTLGKTLGMGSKATRGGARAAASGGAQAASGAAGAAGAARKGVRTLRGGARAGSAARTQEINRRLRTTGQLPGMRGGTNKGVASGRGSRLGRAFKAAPLAGLGFFGLRDALVNDKKDMATRFELGTSPLNHLFNPVSSIAYHSGMVTPYTSEELASQMVPRVGNMSDLIQNPDGSFSLKPGASFNLEVPPHLRDLINFINRRNNEINRFNSLNFGSREEPAPATPTQPSRREYNPFNTDLPGLHELT